MGDTISTTGIGLRPSQIAWLKKQAAAAGRSRGWIVRDLIKKAMGKKKAVQKEDP